MSDSFDPRGSTAGKSRPQDAAISYLARIIADCAPHDVCVTGPMQAAPVELTPMRLIKVVNRYYRFGMASGSSLLDFLAEHLRICDEMRYRIIHHRDWERTLMYLDPTGNHATHNATKEGL